MESPAPLQISYKLLCLQYLELYVVKQSSVDQLQKEFYCPCHDGRYDEFGDVLAGPPPIPLEQFPVRIEGDTVIVGEA